MRILHLAPAYYPSRGGSQSHMREISAYLAAQGHDVTVLTTNALDIAALRLPDRETVAQSEETIDGVRVLRFPVAHITYQAAQHRLLQLGDQFRLPLQVMRRVAARFPNVPAMRDWLRQTDETFDLVAAMHLPYESIMLHAQAFAERRGVPFVTYPLTHFGAGASPGADAESQFYTMRHQTDVVVRGDGLVAQTPFEAQFYVERGIAAERVIVVGPGVNSAEIQGGNAANFRDTHQIRSPIVISIGNMTRSKGTIQTVEAIRQLWRQDVDVALALIGSISDDFEAYWQSLPADIQQRIHKLGYVDNQVRKDALAAATLLSMPSRIDSFGMTYLEAWLYAKPVIAADSWGVRDLVIDNENGLLVQFGDVAATADSMHKLIANPMLADRLGQAGREQTLAQHQWSTKCERIERFYHRLLVQG